MNVLQRSLNQPPDQSQKSEILSVLQETLGSVGENDEDNTSSGTQSSSSPKETMPQYGTGLTLTQPVVQGGGMDQNQVGTPQSHEASPSDLTVEQKDEIASFASINPELSIDMIRENYAEKFKKIITPDVLTKIMKRGHDGFPKIKEPNKKKTKADQIPQIEEYILEVVNDSEASDLKLTVAELKNKAIQFAKENGSPTFNPSKGWILRFLQRHGKKLPDKNGRTKGDEIRTRNQFSLAEKHEVAKYIVENQNVLAKDVAMIFTEKFAKPLTADTVRRIKSEGDKLLHESLANDNRFKNKSKSSNFPEIEQVMLAVMEEAEKQKMTLTSGYIRNMALELAKQLGIENFNASQGWLQRFQMRHGKKLDDGRKLRQNRPKPSPFVRLTFGEKHEIARYMKENQGMQLKQYAETFTKKWNRNVTERQIMGTKENLEKWADEQYKNSSQSYEKIVRKPRTCLAKAEREEIARFITKHNTMTLEETAKIFSEKWNKDINRTHIASAKRMAQNLFNNENQLNLDHHQKSTDNLLQGGGSGSLGLNQVMRGTDQNRNNEVMGHSYGVTERKLSQDDHLSSGIDLYSQFQLGNHKQEVYKNPFQTDNLLGNSIPTSVSAHQADFKTDFKTDPTNLLDYQTKLTNDTHSSIKAPTLGDLPPLDPTSLVGIKPHLNTTQSLPNDYNPLSNSLNQPNLGLSATTSNPHNQMLHQNQSVAGVLNNQATAYQAAANITSSTSTTGQSSLTLTCPQCYRQFDSAPFFWYHVSVEHNIYSSFNTLNPLNPLNSNGSGIAQTQQATTSSSGLHHLQMNHQIHNTNPDQDQGRSAPLDHFNFGLPHLNPAN